MTTKLGLRELLRAGARSLSRYTGTLLSVFLVESLVAGACMLGISAVLAQAFSHLPMFDEAVDGDLVSLIWCLRHAKPSFVAIGGLVFATLLLWQLVSWFLAGGLYGVFAQRPEGRGDTARCFGASGASTYLAYARLAICSLPAYAVVLFTFGSTLQFVGPRIERALVVGDLVLPLLVVLVPTLLLLHIVWTISDYARVELTLRGESHAPGVVATYLRTIAYVIKRPLTLVHAGIGWAWFVLITLAYMVIAHGRPMYGAEGALALFIARQGVSLLRMALRAGVLAGQVELGRTRSLPPRRVEPAVAVEKA